MVKLKIDNQEVEVEQGTPVLLAAKKVGKEIPTMCWHEGLGHITSCMVCLVKDNSNGRLLPSCSVAATEGMEIITLDDEIKEARQMALELLLSEHVGDCEAPCQIACPAHMDIPNMNRFIAEGKPEEALKTVIKDIALPSVLGRICPAPCEGACKRKPIDGAVSICLLKRFVGDEAADAVFKNLKIQPSKNKKVAIIGSGPAGLAAAFNLQIDGYSCTIFEKEIKPGGLLRTSVPDGKLPEEVLDKEIQNILNTGVVLKVGETIDTIRFSEIKNTFDAVIIAAGNSKQIYSDWDLEMNPKGIEVNKDTYETSVPGIFAVGNVLRPSRLAVRSLGQGKEAAFSVGQYLSGKEVKGEVRLFNSKFGKLLKEEFTEYLQESVETKRQVPITNGNSGFTEKEAIAEAARCLHCDCRKFDNCKLRDFSEEYKANQKHFNYSERKPVVKKFNHEILVYEPRKCIKCGICVQLTAQNKEKFGLTYIGRGFDLEIGIPFNEELKDALKQTAKIVAYACPTGALALKNK